MDVEINAQGRMVRLYNVVSTDSQEVADLALNLWASTEPEKNEVTATGFVHTERDSQPAEVAYMGYGERPVVK